LKNAKYKALYKYKKLTFDINDFDRDLEFKSAFYVLIIYFLGKLLSKFKLSYYFYLVKTYA